MCFGRFGGAKGLLDRFRTKPYLLDRCQWISIRFVQCLGKGKCKGKKGDKIRSRYPKLSNSKNIAGIAMNGDTSVPTARNASPTTSRKVVRQVRLLTMETSQP